MSCRTNRRGFLKNAALGTAGWWILQNSDSVWSYQANEKLNIAIVGVGNFGRTHIPRVARINHNLVAICDVNEEHMDSVADLPPDVRKYQDFRKLFDEMDRQIDAVIVATPHQNQPAIAAAAMKRGKHVYCEKPLSHDVGEARRIRQIANECKVVTQMGNQGIATDSFRRILEQVQERYIGEIRKAHVWYGFGGRGPAELPTDTPPPPDTLNWDLYLGPASARSYHPDYMKGWNGWRDFGTGTLGMCGSHSIQMAFRALNLKALWDEKEGAGGKIRVEAEVSEPCLNTFPRWEIVRFDIPPRGSMPAARINWYNAKEEELKRLGIWEGMEKIAGRSLDWSSQDPKMWAPRAGSLLVGSKGVVHANAHNSMCTLLPEKDFPNQGGPPRIIPRAGSHEREWANACCKGGPTPLSNFDDASRTIELVLLGNIATLVGKPLEFDPAAGRITNNNDADRALRPQRREGWAL